MIHWILFKFLRILIRLGLLDEKTVFFKKIKKLSIKINDDLQFIEYVKKKKEGIDTSNNIETLALRGSTADYSFHPSVYPNSYNLGLTSTDLYTCYKIYIHYRESLQSLKDVILFFGVFVPGYSLIDTVEKYRAVVYKYFFSIPYMKENLLVKRYERRIIKQCKKSKKENETGQGNGYFTKTYYSNYIDAKDRTKGHIRENLREPNQLSWLTKLADEINQDNRRLIIVLPPFRTDYKEHIPSFSKAYKKVFDLNLKDVKIIDFTNEKVVTDEDFGDTEHLLEQGAIKLTKRLYQIIHKN